MIFLILENNNLYVFNYQFYDGKINNDIYKKKSFFPKFQVILFQISWVLAKKTELDLYRGNYFFRTKKIADSVLG